MKKNFHIISYLQYPFMALGIYYAIKPYFYILNKAENNTNLYFQDINSMLFFMGLALSFSTLQDTTKTQNKISKKIWENPKKGKIAINFMIIFQLFLFTIGIIGYFSSNNSRLKELSFGIIIFGIGYLGILKAAIEMFENHRLD